MLHHLEDPARAVREAWRVARRGVVLAEPCTDPSIASQRAMARFDELTSALQTRGGHVHHPYLSAGELIALAPQPPRAVEARGYWQHTAVPEAEGALPGGRGGPRRRADRGGALPARRLPGGRGRGRAVVQRLAGRVPAPLGRPQGMLKDSTSEMSEKVIVSGSKPTAATE